MSLVSSYWESMLRYDENPQAYIISMHTMSVVSLVFFGFGAYCVIKKKKAVSPMYRKLLLLYMTINILSQICWTSLYLPHMILPYTAGNTLGFFRTVGFPPELQLTIQFTLLGALGGCTALMFFYRLWVILPPNHLYTRKYIYVTFLVSLFCMSCIVPPPLIAWACYSSPTELIKQHLIQKFGFVTEQLFDNQTLAFEMSVGSPMFITVCYFVVCIVCSAWIIGWTMRSIGLALRSYTDQMTTTTKKQHRSLTHMLYVQTLVVVGCISLPFTAFAIFMWFGIPACGILHICFVIYSMADPASTAIMVYMHTPYRQTLMELLVRLGLQKQTENVAVATSTVPVTMTISTRARPYARALNNELSNSWSRVG